MADLCEVVWMEMSTECCGRAGAARESDVGWQQDLPESFVTKLNQRMKSHIMYLYCTELAV